MSSLAENKWSEVFDFNLNTENSNWRLIPPDELVTIAQETREFKVENAESDNENPIAFDNIVSDIRAGNIKIGSADQQDGNNFSLDTMMGANKNLEQIIQETPVQELKDEIKPDSQLMGQADAMFANAGFEAPPQTPSGEVPPQAKQPSPQAQQGLDWGIGNDQQDNLGFQSNQQPPQPQSQAIDMNWGQELNRTSPTAGGLLQPAALVPPPQGSNQISPQNVVDWGDAFDTQQKSPSPSNVAPTLQAAPMPAVPHKPFFQPVVKIPPLFSSHRRSSD